MKEIPVKKYRVRRAKKWLKRTLNQFGCVAEQIDIMRSMPYEEA